MCQGHGTTAPIRRGFALVVHRSLDGIEANPADCENPYFGSPAANRETASAEIPHVAKTSWKSRDYSRVTVS